MTSFPFPFREMKARIRKGRQEGGRMETRVAMWCVPVWTARFSCHEHVDKASKGLECVLSS